MQTAVFVDAGYLFQAGVRLVVGEALARREIVLDVAAAIQLIRNHSSDAVPEARLLRIYWYDGALRGGQPSAEQSAIARSDDVKLRLGMVNSQGEQKEVDSLIVTDLIELARNHSISDAMLLAGDGDLRVGVQIAQSFGVRVHLIGIKPALGNIAPELVAEVDRRSEWQETHLRKLLSVRPAPAREAVARSPAASVQDAFDAEIALRLDDAADAAAVVAHVRATGKIPPEIDRPALASLGARLGRELSYKERAEFRALFATAIERRPGETVAQS